MGQWAHPILHCFMVRRVPEGRASNHARLWWSAPVCHPAAARVVRGWPLPRGAHLTMKNVNVRISVKAAPSHLSTPIRPCASPARRRHRRRRRRRRSRPSRSSSRCGSGSCWRRARRAPPRSACRRPGCTWHRPGRGRCGWRRSRRTACCRTAARSRAIGEEWGTSATSPSRRAPSSVSSTLCSTSSPASTPSPRRCAPPSKRTAMSSISVPW